MVEIEVSQRQRKAKSEKYHLFQEALYHGMMKDSMIYENVTQCINEVRCIIPSRKTISL